MTRRRGGVDWSWARYEIGRAAEVPRRPPAAELDTTLARDASHVDFARPLSSTLPLACFSLTWIIPGVWRRVRDRVRVAWNAAAIVVSHADGSAHRVARADVTSVRRDATSLALVLATGEAIPLVAARTPRAADLAQAGDLAVALGVPYVDDSGAGTGLPRARVRPTP